ncbi:unnamed protein product, partial [Amoebophrya sp. A120]
GAPEPDDAALAETSASSKHQLLRQDSAEDASRNKNHEILGSHPAILRVKNEEEPTAPDPDLQKKTIETRTLAAAAPSCTSKQGEPPRDETTSTQRAA